MIAHLLSKFDIGAETRYSRPMTLNVSLTPHLEHFIQQTLSSGRYQSASEVVRTALRLLEEHEQQKAATLEWLRGEIQKGIDSGPGSPVTPAFWEALRAELKNSAAGSNA